MITRGGAPKLTEPTAGFIRHFNYALVQTKGEPTTSGVYVRKKSVSKPAADRWISAVQPGAPGSAVHACAGLLAIQGSAHSFPYVTCKTNLITPCFPALSRRFKKRTRIFFSTASAHSLWQAPSSTTAECRLPNTSCSRSDSAMRLHNTVST